MKPSREPDDIETIIPRTIEEIERTFQEWKRAHYSKKWPCPDSDGEHCAYLAAYELGWLMSEQAASQVPQPVDSVYTPPLAQNFQS